MEKQQGDEVERAARNACQYAPNDASLRAKLSAARHPRGKPGNLAGSWPGP